MSSVGTVDRKGASLSPEPAPRVEDHATTTATATASPSPPPPVTPQPLDSVWLSVYDRVSHGCFRVQIHDPLLLRILNNSVMTASENDGALSCEMGEFVDYVDKYERARVLQQQSASFAARRNVNGSSGSVGYASGGLYTGSGVASRGVGSDATTGNPSFGGSLPGGAAAPTKFEDTLRQTLSDNSDFFFRVASVAYQLGPSGNGVATYTAAQTLPSSAGAGIRGGDVAGRTGAASDVGSLNSGVGVAGGAATAALTAGQLVSAAASGVSSMLTGTLSSPNVPAAPHRNYAVDSGYSAAFHLCARLFAVVYRDHCHALAEKVSARFSALRVEDCVKFRKAVWTGFHLKAVDPYRTATRSESNLELRWVSEKIKDDKHLFPDGGVIPQQQQQLQQQQQQNTTSSMTRIMDATLSYVANARRRVQPITTHGSTGTASATAAAGGGGGKRHGNLTGAASAAAASTDGGAPPTSGGASKDASGAPENEIQTFGLTKLLHNPSWQKDEESSDTCPSCGRAFLSMSRPLGARAHHCRSCGVRLCVFCITKRAHYSFAKLTKPGSVDESEERFVCDVCYGEYETTRQLHYLGALFALAGLGFSDLVLCRTVNEQWREAAELCISEYRLLLHTCDADLHSVMTPVGVLLQNSLFLLLGEGPTSSISVVHHPEAALVLLKFIATENLWMQDASYYFITRLSSSILNRADTVLDSVPCFAGSTAASSASSTGAGASNGGKKDTFHLPVIPTLSHWHLFCTAFCSRINSSFFFVKCAELLCTAPVRVYDAYLAKALERMTRLYLNTTPLWRRLAAANRAMEKAFQREHNASSNGHGGGTSLPPPAPPTLADVTEGQLVTIWLLDMLHKDALVPAPRRRYQQLLERVIPTVATSSLSLVFIMILSLRSTYTYYGYDEELFGLWRSRILAEVARADAEAGDRVAATLDFYSEFDRFCAQSAALHQFAVVEWIVRYCGRGRSSSGLPGEAHATGGVASTAAGGVGGAPPSSARVGRDMYMDLPHPILNPFKPYLVLRSIRLTGIRVAPNAATKPIWLAFSTRTAAEHLAYHDAFCAAEAAAKEAAATTRKSSNTNSPLQPPPSATAKSSTEKPKASPASAAATAFAAGAAGMQECMFLYKRENVERDQLMCISSRLLQMLLASEIGAAEMLDYSVIPLSCDSGLIEKAAGRELSNLENMDITSYVLHRGQQGCTNFLASAKIFLLLNYIFSIGDRHKGNVLIGSNGALLHIDFRFIFSEKTFVEKLARSTVRIDDAFLAAVEECQLRQYCAAAPAAAPAGAEVANAGSKPTPATTSFSFFAHPRVSPPGSPQSPGSGAGGAGMKSANTASPAGGQQASTPPTPAELRAAFFASAAEWFVHVRPFAAVFYELWLYAVHRHTVPYDEREMLTMLNTLFDRHASQSSSASKFSTTMRESVNVCRLKDVTHSSAEVLRSFTDQVSRRVTESGAGAVKMVGSMWSSWWTRGS